ncbi:MAG: tetratricopeptide repeat protein [Spirochaetaceae bacterium]|nr:tetratricopeptide repeat protein [Spirochaetaceae bacterium]MBO4705120.1 tetratricopeptide repeat protein [Spirochaetaceae bacterium]
MQSIIPIIIAAVAIFSLIALILGISSARRRRAGSSSSVQKTRQAIIREATKKLSQDPHNISGLLPLSELYYKEQLWDKAFPLYDTLLNIAVAHPEVDIFTTALRQGVCALKVNKLEESFRGLLQARKLQPDNFEVNFYLGQTFYSNKEYDKAIPLLKKAITINKEVQDTYRYVGLALYKYHSFRESLPYIKRALDLNPDDKELLFAMADAMNESGNGEKALKIFMHLRPDPEFGAKSCLAAGTIHANQKLHDKAILDFEIGLKHTQAPLDILTNIRYRLSHSYISMSDISRALATLKEIQQTVPGYKDVQALIARYQELTQNANLQIYLISSNSDFIALCRKIVQIYFGKAFVKIIDINATNECTEVQTEIETAKWEDSVVFRFYRTTGSTGELFVREFHTRIRDLKVGRGLCFTAGTYTEEARKYIEGRPIDLIDKSGLIKILNKVDTKSPF